MIALFIGFLGSYDVSMVNVSTWRVTYDLNLCHCHYEKNTRNPKGREGQVTLDGAGGFSD